MTFGIILYLKWTFKKQIFAYDNKTFPVSTNVLREAILKRKHTSGGIPVADVKRIVTEQQKNDLNFQSALNNREILLFLCNLWEII